jgi:hypothetical protein
MSWQLRVVLGLMGVVVGLIFAAGAVAGTAKADEAAPMDVVPPVPARARLRLVCCGVAIVGSVVYLGLLVFG